ncbi:MAG: tRNA pseudouridine(55) synthase TruB [Desulfuromonadales bacterium]|nr:tRNA pseudouridine(55) synthase TruB [Desulfuromonadales bacterium]
MPLPDMHGLLLIDKPQGLTSHDVVSRVRRICKTRKVGHAGTLDPLATGVLPVAVGNATKVLQFLLMADKSYRATLRLGETTTTLDSEGAVVARRVLPDSCRERLEQLLPSFRGRIEQVPPMYSALKKDGVPLYKLARQGQSVEREPRTVEIARLEIVSCALPDVVIEVDCSKGTYIRTLAEDLGNALGCGAHLTALRRLASGPFTVDQCVSLERLAETGAAGCVGLVPIESALSGYPSVELNSSAAEKLRFGVPPQTESAGFVQQPEPGSLVCLMHGGQLLAMALYEPGREREKRGDFELLRVFVGA